MLKLLAVWNAIRIMWWLFILIKFFCVVGIEWNHSNKILRHHSALFFKVSNISGMLDLIVLCCSGVMQSSSNNKRFCLKISSEILLCLLKQSLFAVDLLLFACFDAVWGYVATWDCVRLSSCNQSSHHHWKTSNSVFTAVTDNGRRFSSSRCACARFAT